ncbi:MAG TPA: hypothetical protein VL634_25535 [Mycobacterium sp.]|nr:hypothetical protein [Mycobacterium sp.]
MLLILTIGVFAGASWFLHHRNAGALKEHAIEIAGFGAGLFGLLLTGIFIPYQISAASDARQERTNCFNSVLALREQLNQINVNYKVAPQQIDQRMVDWDTLGTKLDNTTFACHNAKLDNSASSSVLASLRNDLERAKTLSQHYAPDVDYLKRVSDWSTAALGSLQKD